MPKCVVDGKEVEFKPGENLIDVARKAGIEIPYFCYHPGLTVVAQCRMCAVEIEKMPKLQTACSTPATEGMIVHTRSAKAKQNQKSVMEFLLINHPLDCPICDKAGECDLQDNSFKYGDSNQRTTEERRTYLDLDMGPVIKKNMNRCIHCTRCIRFGTEVAGIHEMVATHRGNSTEISTIDGRPLETEYASNYADICPTGSLTLKDFRFKKRVWFLKKTESICDGCSRGCNTYVHQDAEAIHRLTPRENMEINKWWMCDEGRFGFHYVNDPQRVIEPWSQGRGLSWSEVIEQTQAALSGKKPMFMIGTDLTQEEIAVIQGFVREKFSGAPVFHYGTAGVKSATDDAAADKILKRKSKTANLHGAEKLGVAGWPGAIPAGVNVAVVFRGGKAAIPSELKGMPMVGVGVFGRADAQKFNTILPGLTFAEKEGTVVNFEGREQKLKKAIKAPRLCKSLTEVVMLWSGNAAQRGQANVAGGK